MNRSKDLVLPVVALCLAIPASPIHLLRKIDGGPGDRGNRSSHHDQYPMTRTEDTRVSESFRI